MIITELNLAEIPTAKYQEFDPLTVPEIFSVKKELALTLRDIYSEAFFTLADARGIRERIDQVTVSGRTVNAITRDESTRTSLPMEDADQNWIRMSEIKFNTTPSKREGAQCLEITVTDQAHQPCDLIYIQKPAQPHGAHYAIRIIHHNGKKLQDEVLDMGIWNGREYFGTSLELMKRELGVGSQIPQPISPDAIKWQPFAIIRDVLAELITYQTQFAGQT